MHTKICVIYFVTSEVTKSVSTGCPKHWGTLIHDQGCSIIFRVNRRTLNLNGLSPCQSWILKKDTHPPSVLMQQFFRPTTFLLFPNIFKNYCVLPKAPKTQGRQPSTPVSLSSVYGWSSGLWGRRCLATMRVCMWYSYSITPGILGISLWGEIKFLG